MTELNPNTARTESQDFQGKNFQPRSDRPIAAAMRHVAQVILFLRRAMLAAHGRRARSIHHLIEAQKAVFDGLRLLDDAESDVLENGDRHIAAVARDELAALAVERSVGSGSERDRGNGR